MIITFIDTETTGLDLLSHEVIDIAALQVFVTENSYVELTRLEAKITPANIASASPVALKINGYSKRKWKNSLPASSTLPIIKSLIETSTYVAGQNLVFDYRFINKMFDAQNVDRPKWPQYIDTKWMADQLVHDKKIKRSSLDFLCEHYQVPTIGRAHTALTDVLRTVEIYKILSKQTETTYLNFDKPYDPYGDRNEQTRKG